MVDKFRSFFGYYRKFCAEMLAQVWTTWRAEVLPAVLLAAVVFLLSYKHDTNAKMAFLYTVEACGIYVVGWTIYHLIRTPWKLSLKENGDATGVSFKTEVFALSASILDFIYERSKGIPTSPAQRLLRIGEDTASLFREIAEHSAQQAACKKYEADTLNIYAYKFSRTVSRTVAALNDMGLHDDKMEGVWDNPPHSETIKLIGERLGMLADRILDPLSK